MGKNVAVFVDVANIFYAAKAAGVDIDYVTMLKSATAGRDLVRAYAYTGLDPDNENQRNFHDFLRRSNYKVVSKDIRKYGDGKVKANLDIELVVDMMKTARNLDIAIVVSGDGDFAPAIRAVQEMGVRVEVISFRGNTSSDLIEVADLFTDIIQIARVEKGTGRSGRRVATDDEDLSMTEVPDKQTEGTGTGRGRGRGTGRSRVGEGERVAAASRPAAGRGRSRVEPRRRPREIASAAAASIPVAGRAGSSRCPARSSRGPSSAGRSCRPSCRSVGMRSMTSMTRNRTTPSRWASPAWTAKSRDADADVVVVVVAAAVAVTVRWWARSTSPWPQARHRSTVSTPTSPPTPQSSRVSPDPRLRHSDRSGIPSCRPPGRPLHDATCRSRRSSTTNRPFRSTSSPSDAATAALRPSGRPVDGAALAPATPPRSIANASAVVVEAVASIATRT